MLDTSTEVRSVTVVLPSALCTTLCFLAAAAAALLLLLPMPTGCSLAGRAGCLHSRSRYSSL